MTNHDRRHSHLPQKPYRTGSHNITEIQSSPMKVVHKSLKLIQAAIMLLTAGIVYGQNGTMTPYSRYGYGILSDNATSMQRSMGYTGYAMNSGRQINVMNPASYACIDSLTFLFDMGLDLTTMWSEENGHTEKNFGGGLDYITMQVPIGKYMGASVGILPFGSVGYSFGSAIDNGNTLRSGDGSINQLYLGVAGRPFKGFTVGANIAYLFGSTTNDLYATAITGTTSVFQRNMTIRDWRADFGVQYSMRLKPGRRLTLGLTYSPAKDLHGHTYGLYYDMSSSSSTPDTVGYSNLNGNYSLPEKWGAGVNLQIDTRWMFEIDYTYQPWSKAKYAAIENFEKTDFADRWRIGMGAQWQPNIRGGYGKRIYYRLGAYYTNDYLLIHGNNVREHGITAGLGFPVPGFKTIVNLGFEWKHRQAHPDPLLKENYFNITIGVNFNEMWFQKAKIY